MTYVRPDVYKAVEDNDLNEVIFKDPFSEETRKAKRNLMVASFISVLISILTLKITGFLGLQAESGTLGNEVARGLAFIVVAYLLVSFVFHVFIDYSAWQFNRERQLTQPYLELLEMFENHVYITAEQVKAAVSPLFNANENPMQVMLAGYAKNMQDQLNEIINRLFLIETETRPLRESWKKTISAMDRLNFRLKARFASLWLLDILVPVAFAVFAAVKSYGGLPILLNKLV